VLAACQPTGGPSSSSNLAPLGDVVRAEVTRVSDGDTIYVEIDGQEQILRYIGIDAPEIEGPYKELEWLGPEAAEANRDYVEDTTVWLERDVSDTDPNGRLLRYVWKRYGPGWLMVNRELVKMGLAEAHDYEPDTRYHDLLFAAQDDAQAADAGLWGPSPPPH
jgi:micrococcal nuclease